MNDSRPHSHKASNTSSADAAGDSPLSRALAEYLELQEAGNAPSRTEYVARFPEVAEALSECLQQMDWLGKVAGELSGDLLASGARDGNDDDLTQSNRVLGDYRLIREVGRGGMGIVYEAEQISLGRRVALKVLPTAAILDPRALTRFKNEVHAAASLDHPHIVDVIGVGCERGIHYYAMRFVDGPTLANVIRQLQTETQSKKTSHIKVPAAHKNQPPIDAAASSDSALALNSTSTVDSPEPTAALARSSHLTSLTGPAFFRAIAQLGIDAAEALHHAHEQGVIHRDIKPSNLMLDSRGKLWVTDFGLAHIETGGTLTMTGELVGTLRYMSPEQASGPLGVDHRADVYSLGATLYELLTLQPAFAGANRSELLQQILLEDPRPLCKLRPEIPVDLETIVLKAMAKVPGDRYATAQEMAEDLRRFQSDRPIVSRRVTAWGRMTRWARRNPVVTSLLAMVVTTLIAGATVSTVLAARANQALKDYRREHERAKENLHNAVDTVQRLLTRVSQEQLFNTPGATDVRRQLLIEAGTQLEVLSRGQHDSELLALTAAAYRDIADIHHHCGDYTDALAAASHALNQHQALLLSVNEKYVIMAEIASDRLVLGEIYFSQSRGLEAESELNQAIGVMSDLRRQFPAELRHIAALEDMIRLRGLVRGISSLDSAEVDFNAALAIARELVEQPVRASTAPSDWLRIVRNQVYLSNIRRLEKDQEAALRLIEDTLSIIDRIEVQLNRNDTQISDAANERVSRFAYPFKLQVAWVKTEALIVKGQIQRAIDDQNGARSCFLEAVRILEPIARDYPGILWSRSQLATAYAWLSGSVDEPEADIYFGAAAKLVVTLPAAPFKGYICNQLAWDRVSFARPNYDYRRAVDLGRIAVEFAPNRLTWNTLGVALYRAQMYEEAIRALTESDTLEIENQGYNAMFLAMSNWELGNAENARKWYQQGVSEMAAGSPNPELARFRSEAEAVLGIVPGPSE